MTSPSSSPISTVTEPVSDDPDHSYGCHAGGGQQGEISHHGQTVYRTERRGQNISRVPLFSEKYHFCSKENILGITELLIADLRKRIEQKQLKLTVTEKAKEYIAEEGYDPAFGARPLKRFVQSAVETLIARKIISENLEPETEIKVDFDGTSLIIV